MLRERSNKWGPRTSIRRERANPEEVMLWRRSPDETLLQDQRIRGEGVLIKKGKSVF